uniref:Biogenesis of lysosome-related organelles complex 1 subunit 1 n=1 Tax=Catagonus wagneri TaxID=51154 RepID=A0A8C3YCK1_9CETA
MAQAYINQRKLDHEVKTRQVQAAQFAKQTGQWIGMVENFNQTPKELRNVENWAPSIELDMCTIATMPEYVYKGQLPALPLLAPGCLSFPHSSFPPPGGQAVSKNLPPKNAWTKRSRRDLYSFRRKLLLLLK